MLKFIWGKGHQPNAERLKVQKELFGFNKVVQHGFPHKPTAIAFDPELKLLAIGTKQGLVRIYGRPGVEFYGEHDDEVCVTKILFLPNQGRLVTLTEHNCLYLWEIDGDELKNIKSTKLEGRLKHVSVMCYDKAKSRVLLGTEGGNIYFLNLWNFKIDENLIYQDIVMQNAPGDFKVNPGAVEGLLLHPAETEHILIGYARGLIVLWDRAANLAVKTYVANQQLESLSWWNEAGSQFVSVHNDGSYISWSTSSTQPLEAPNTPYGPYPCKAVNKVVASTVDDTQWTFFSGGMPRASYGDKHTVSLIKGDEKHTVFDLTSKVVDFIVVAESGAPSCLLILSEEELVVVDVTDDAWPVLALPYLNPIHASSVTCITHVPDVDNRIVTKIVEAGRNDAVRVSSRPWPVDGGKVYAAEDGNEEEVTPKDVLITGHEDGSVKFWGCVGVTLTPLATVKTKPYFVADDLDAEPEEEEEDEEEWPPFRKIGHFDPYSDDPRMAVKKVLFCPRKGRLYVGGTAGQVVAFGLADEAKEHAMQSTKADLVTEKEGFAWKGHGALSVQAKEIKMASGFQPTAIVQIFPPASINSIGFCAEWELMAIGTAHGVVVVDTLQKAVVTAKCTLNAQDIANADDNPMSRRKSLKKSLRESFRRLRKGRSQRNIDKKKPASHASSNDPIKRELRSESPDVRPVERAVEARSGSEDGLGSMVRCLHFAHTYIANPQTISATLWAGTNSGQILVFLINVPAGGQRKTEKPSAMLAKEIQLKHKAPVISVQVLDAGGVPIPLPKGDGVETTQPHRVFIASEEQFKMFYLPTLKPCGKFKLTAHEGSRVRKVGFSTFVSKSDPDHAENCFTCLTNVGDLAIHSLPDLKRQVLQTQCMKREDVIAISSLAFTPEGEAFYLCSSSELQRVSVAAAKVLKPKGTVVVSDGQRFDVEGEKSKEAAAAKPKPMAVEEPAAAGDTDSVVARQNQLNEKEAEVVKSPTTKGDSVEGSSMAPPKDLHNDTTVSDISADITVDSVKDHTLIQRPPEVVVTDTAEATATAAKPCAEPDTVVEAISANDDTAANDKADVKDVHDSADSSAPREDRQPSSSVQDETPVGE